MPSSGIAECEAYRSREDAEADIQSLASQCNALSGGGSTFEVSSIVAMTDFNNCAGIMIEGGYAVFIQITVKSECSSFPKFRKPPTD
jgi:hypothetical protein